MCYNLFFLRDIQIVKYISKKRIRKIQNYVMVKTGVSVISAFREVSMHAS